MLYIADTTGQALAVALLLLVGELAPALLSPLAGTVSDRFNLKRVMVCCELIQGALVAVTALWLPSLPLLLVLVGLRSLAGQVFQPASRAVVPALVRDDDLRARMRQSASGPTQEKCSGRWPRLCCLLRLTSAVCFSSMPRPLSFPQPCSPACRPCHDS
jgi:MFS family permease